MDIFEDEDWEGARVLWRDLGDENVEHAHVGQTRKRDQRYHSKGLPEQIKQNKTAWHCDM